MVDVVLAAAFGGVGDIFGGSTLGADEQHASAGGGHVAHGAQRAIQQRHRLLQIDDVHLVAHAEQVRTHRRVPAAGVVAKMHAGFEELAQGEFGHRHGAGPFAVVRLCLRGAESCDLETLRHRTRPGRERRPACELPAHAGGRDMAKMRAESNPSAYRRRIVRPA